MEIEAADREFEEILKRTMEAFGKQVRTQTAARQERVLARLEEEMARLRPHKERLVTGSKGGSL